MILLNFLKIIGENCLKAVFRHFRNFFLVSQARFPDRRCFTAYSPEERTLSYTEAKEKIFKLAGSLLDAGLKKGDRVFLTGKNSPEWAVSYLGVLTAGGIVVPVDYMMSESEMENLINFSESSILIVDEEKYDTLLKESSLMRYSLSDKKDNYVYNVVAAVPEKPVELSVDDTAAILFTSGTTGNPKGVVLSHSNFVNDALLAQGNLNIYHTDVFYALLPLHHSYSMLAVLLKQFATGAESCVCCKTGSKADSL